MAELFPFKFEPVGERILLTNDAGDFFYASSATLERLVNGSRNKEDNDFLLGQGFAFKAQGDFYYESFRRRLFHRKEIEKRIVYLIAIPTLRCDLSCQYCQVSRADKNAAGFDWSDETTANFMGLLDRVDTHNIKVEFQGGEPTLRTDILKRIISHLDHRDTNAQFIICTNLNTLSDELLALLERPNVFVSTSLDGTAAAHQANRTDSPDGTRRFFENLDEIRRRFGADKVSALPTIASLQPEFLRSLIDTYVRLGFPSIFLRPVNYHGFARKRFADTREAGTAWSQAYRLALDMIFETNEASEGPIREFMLEVALSRIFRSSSNNHVDLRSPNPAALDYLVIDYDGRFFPSDEARMLARIGHSDLSIGSLGEGVNIPKSRSLSWNQINEIHPDCLHCAYQPYCGIDTIDDLSRYNRIDKPKHETWFCQVNMNIFSFIFERLQSNSPRDLRNLAFHLTGHYDLIPFYGQLHND